MAYRGSGIETFQHVVHLLVIVGYGSLASQARRFEGGAAAYTDLFGQTWMGEYHWCDPNMLLLKFPTSAESTGTVAVLELVNRHELWDLQKIDH